MCLKWFVGGAFGSMQAVVLDGDPNAAQPAPLVPNGIPGVARVENDPFSLRQPAGPASPLGARYSRISDRWRDCS